MTTSTMTPEEHSAAVMAADAMKLALAEHWEPAAAMAQGILDIYGETGAYVALLLWSDALITYRGGRLDPSKQLTFFNINEGPNPTSHGADEAPPWARWAGRFIFARALDDRGQCEALIGTCTGQKEVFEENLLGVLEMVATNIAMTERRRYGN